MLFLFLFFIYGGAFLLVRIRHGGVAATSFLPPPLSRILSCDLLLPVTSPPSSVMILFFPPIQFEDDDGDDLHRSVAIFFSLDEGVLFFCFLQTLG